MPDRRRVVDVATVAAESDVESGCFSRRAPRSSQRGEERRSLCDVASAACARIWRTGCPCCQQRQHPRSNAWPALVRSTLRVPRRNSVSPSRPPGPDLAADAGWVKCSSSAAAEARAPRHRLEGPQRAHGEWAWAGLFMIFRITGGSDSIDSRHWRRCSLTFQDNRILSWNGIDGEICTWLAPRAWLLARDGACGDFAPDLGPWAGARRAPGRGPRATASAGLPAPSPPSGTLSAAYRWGRGLWLAPKRGLGLVPRGATLRGAARWFFAARREAAAAGIPGPGLHKAGDSMASAGALHTHRSRLPFAVVERARSRRRLRPAASRHRPQYGVLTISAKNSSQYRPWPPHIAEHARTGGAGAQGVVTISSPIPQSSLLGSPGAGHRRDPPRWRLLGLGPSPSSVSHSSRAASSGTIRRPRPGTAADAPPTPH